MKKARYIRVSTSNQSTARQEIKAHKDEEIYLDKVSGSIPFNEREEGKRLLFDIAMGNIDEVSVSSIDRLGRNSFDIQTTLNLLQKSNINVKVDNLGLESMVNGEPNPIFKMICDVLSNVAEMERTSLLERQKEGIALAKKKGVYRGREKGTVETDEEVLTKYPNAVKAIKKYPDGSLRELAKLGECSMNTIKKLKLILDKSIQL